MALARTISCIISQLVDYLAIILGIPVSLTDLKYFDPEIYKSMKWIRENNGVDALDLDFTVTDRRGEDVVAIDLIPNGANIEVTDDNKEE
uniref:HECT-type E3 ubiquitin transferase n=1 Tax=Globisporangium ultimum (strain ATCC 200006 / CBS 805.95 / DAOM BR144) TaxID=431595 RepID=K3X467_GLOUD